MINFNIKDIKKDINYNIKLQEFLSENDNTVFEYGKNDCLLFTAKAIEAMALDYKVVDDVKSQFNYRSQSGAAKALLKLGYKSPMEMLEANAIKLANIYQVKTGDIAIIKNELGEMSSGVVCGPFVFGPSDRGLARVSIMEIYAAYTWGKE